MQMDPNSLMQAILKVKRREQLTPHYIRIILTGDDIQVFQRAETGDNNKIIIPKDKALGIELPDMITRNLFDYPNQVVRTYTLRSFDAAKKEMAIDFVVHHNPGPASVWAMNAKPGDELGVMMKAGRKKLLRAADKYYFFGDHSALPVISGLLEKLDPAAKGHAYIEVQGKEDVMLLNKPAGIDITWLFNEYPGDTSALPAAFNAMAAKVNVTSAVYVFAEHKAVNEIQDKLRKNPAIRRENWQAYGYWKQGECEDRSMMERAATMKV
ncbi:siderophore-interacting protein [Chitinophaga sancti]|uniref:siderophore-interacting protein n=1 Tax=Chitinophaga sancti TaxID=1004 RepID=UPI003F79DA8E